MTDKHKNSELKVTFPSYITLKIKVKRMRFFLISISLVLFSSLQAQNTLDIVQGKWFGMHLGVMYNDSIFFYRDSLEAPMPNCQSSYIEFYGNQMKTVVQFTDTCSAIRSVEYQSGKVYQNHYSVSDDRGFLKLTESLRNQYGLFTVKKYTNGITLFREKVAQIK
jgi:hypothetical protein